MTRHQQLIRATLAYARMSGKGCFRTNAAAGELRDFGEEVLSEIELEIQSSVAAESSRVRGRHELLEKFPGLLNLWMTYFLSSEPHQLERAAQFLRSLQGPVLATAIVAMTSTWLYRQPASGLPRELRELVRELLTNTSSEVAEVAGNLLKRENPEPDKHSLGS